MSKTKLNEKKVWEMLVAGLAMDPASNVPVVVLRDVDGLHQVPIWIGQVEAMAIATELEGVKHSRPMTHDLLRNVIERLGSKVSRVEIFELKDNTFYARIVLESEGGELEIDSRPSDAIALAIRANAPIYAADYVVQQARMDIPEDIIDDLEDGDEDSESEAQSRQTQKKEPHGPRPIVGPMPGSDEEWEDLLENLDSTDFGKYKQ